MNDVSHRLCTARKICASERRLAVLAVDGCTAHGAVFRHIKVGFFSRALFGERFHHFGDYVSGFLNKHAVADFYVFLTYIIKVVERCTAHARAGKSYRFKLRCGGENASSSDVYKNIFYCCFFLLGRIFKRYRPARNLCSFAQNLAVGERIYLYNRAVGIVVIPFARVSDFRDFFKRAVD